MTRHTKLIAGGIVLALVLIVVLVAFNKHDSLRNQGIAKEAALTAQYEQNQTELSNYILTVTETLGVADANAARVQEILEGAITARDSQNDGQVFSALAEAYPDLTATSEAYQKVQDAIVSGRETFNNKQSRMLDMVRSYNTWVRSGFIDSTIIRNLGFPSDDITVTIGDQTWTGEEALRKMGETLKTAEGNAAYESGEMGPIIGGNRDNSNEG